MLNGGDVREGLRHAIPLAVDEGDLRAPARQQGCPGVCRPGDRDLSISPVRTPARSSSDPGRRSPRSAARALSADVRAARRAGAARGGRLRPRRAVAGRRRGRRVPGTERRAIAAPRSSPRPAAAPRGWSSAPGSSRAIVTAPCASRASGAPSTTPSRGSRNRTPTIARQLRWLWADALAASGSYADAVDIVRTRSWRRRTWCSLDGARPRRRRSPGPAAAGVSGGAGAGAVGRDAGAGGDLA